MQKRVMSVWFPLLPVNRLMRKGQAEESLPFSVVHEHKNSLRLYSLNQTALRLGLEQGMALTDARAIEPDLVTRVAEPELDLQLLEALHRWAGQYSPWVAMHCKDSLLLDITGCAHLFGGEQAMMDLVRDELQELGMAVRLALADTKQAAIAMARYGSDQTLIPTGKTRQTIQGLTVDAIQTEAPVTTSLRRLGLKTIGDVLGLPRKSLARRFGMGLVTRLDELIGVSADPVSPAKHKPVFAARMTLPEPIGLLEDVQECVKRLIAQACKRLNEHQMGARQFKLEVGRADNSCVHETIGLARPSRDGGLIFRQFAKPLDRLDAGYGIERLRLIATVTEPFMPEQLNANDASIEARAREEVISRIGNRIGFKNIGQYYPNESHLPEHSFFIAPVISELRKPFSEPVDHLRPLIQFRPEEAIVLKHGRPPKQFSWRHKVYILAAMKGPERILPEWWHHVPDWQDGPRDYWWVQTHEGLRLWLFNTPAETVKENWYVAGVFP